MSRISTMGNYNPPINALTSETIAQQRRADTKGLLKEVGKICDMVRENRRIDLGDDKLFLKINKEVKKMFNMSVILTNEEKGSAWCMTPRLRRGNILSRFIGVVPESVEGDWLIEPNEIEGSTMDHSRVWITGGLSKVPVKLGLNFKTFVGKFGSNDAEVTSVLLHELGHAWNGMSTLSNIVVGNAMIAMALAEETEGFGIHVFKNVPKGANGEMMRTLADAKNPKDAVKRIKLITAIEVHRQHSVNYYDDAGSEALAQSFAVRYGYGLETASFAQKYERTKGDPSKYIINVFGVNTNISMANYQNNMAVMGTLAGDNSITHTQVVGIISFTGLARTSGNFRYRVYKRDQANTRRHMINRIRTLDLSKADRTRLLNDIDEVRVMIENAPKEIETYIGKATALLKSVVSSSKAINNFHEDIENMIDNDLYLEATRLKS